MKIGIVDIGSNTIRIVVYQIDGNTYEEVLNERSFAGLVEDVEEDRLSDIGLEKLLEVLRNIKELCSLVECSEVRCFATASLRGLKNIDEITSVIKEETGYEIDIISGEEEVYYDYIGIKKGAHNKKGVGLDLGGGSCQIFVYDKDGIKASDSFKIGSLLVYKNFVKGLLPTKKEVKKIETYVKGELKKNKALKNTGYDTVYAVGGSIRGAAKLHKALTGGNTPISEYQLTLQDLEEIIDTIYDMGIQGVRLICHVIPERVYTIMPALFIMKTVCKYLGVNKIDVMSNSVREGYLWEKVMRADYSSTEN